SEVVEGYLGLCELVVGLSGGGPPGKASLMLETLQGACMLLRLPGEGMRDKQKQGWKDSLRMVEGQQGFGPVPSIQEAFREHHAQARIVRVMEQVAGAGTGASGRCAAEDGAGAGARADGICWSESDRCAVILALLAFLTALMARNSLGKTAFQRALADKAGAWAFVSDREGGDRAWEARRGRGRHPGAPGIGPYAALAGLVDPLPSWELFPALMEMLLDGPVPLDMVDPAARRAATAGEDGAQEAGASAGAAGATRGDDG
ncbi:unnamed protein product, partial [Discosporangium mesarthrocarpum]